MKKFVILSSLFILSACATNEVLFTDAQGNTVYKAQCDQANNLDMGDCIKLMGQQCPLGFNVLMANEKAKGFMTANETWGNINTDSYAHANAFGIGNNVFANGYGNSQTSFNMDSWGGGSLSYSRYVIYTCKTPQ